MRDSLAIEASFLQIFDVERTTDQKRDKTSFLLEVIDYVHFLQEKVHKYEDSWNNEPPTMIQWVNYDPRILVRKAHAATSSTGSATVIISMLDKNGILKVASVGDCGLWVIRKGQIIFTTFPQEHYFDCPYQLSSEAVTQTYLETAVTSVDSVKGDIIVMGSDGLFDNVFDQEILSTIAKHKDVVEAAKELADVAYKHSVDFYFDSPYSVEARSRGFDVPWWKKVLGQKLTGGKMDDITVIVGEVVSH